MKRKVFIFCVLLNVIGVFIQPCEAQLSSSQLSRFLSYNDNEAYRAIQYAAHPTNKLKYGSVLSVSGNEAYVEIHMKGWIMDDICTKLKLYYDSSNRMFSYVDSYSDNDPAVGAFTALDVVKNFAVERINSTDFMRKITRYFGRNLINLDVRKICAAYLSYLWSKYDGRSSSPSYSNSVSGHWSFTGTLLNEKRNYDQIAFELYASSSGSCSGRFLNYTYGWYPDVSGTISSNSFNIRGGNWTFRVSRQNGNYYSGTATNGRYTYPIELHMTR